MQKILVRVSRGAQRNAEGQSMNYNQRDDLLILELDGNVVVWGEGVQHPHEVDGSPNVRVVSGQAFCLGDQSGGQIGRPLDEIFFPLTLRETMEALNFQDYEGDPGYWQVASILRKKEILDVIASPHCRPRRRGIQEAVYNLVRTEWSNIPVLYLDKELVDRIITLVEGGA